MMFKSHLCYQLLTIASACCFAFLHGTIEADDWPQWMGPQRDNVWRESGIIDQFPPQGPKILWRTSISGGYAGPAVVGNNLVITDYVTSDNVKVDNFQRKEFTGSERVLCLDAESGEVKWKHEYPVKYTVSYPAGPRCTPVFDEGKVYTLGAEGHLFCFEVESGEIVWSKHFSQDYQAETALWGYASHPLIDGKKLICVVGGKGSQVVAFDKATGKELWKALSAPEQGYSPPKIFSLGGMRQLLSLSPGGLSGLNPATGEVYWTVPYEASNGSIIMTPVVHENLVYAGGYSNKNMLVQVADHGKSAKVLWRNRPKAALSPVNVQPFNVANTIYGLDQNGLLYAVDFETGDRIWQSGEPLASTRPVGSGTAFIVKQANRYWLFNELGELIIATLSRDGYQEIDRAKVIEPTNTAFGRDVVWSMPAFAHRKAYIRNDKEIICVDLAMP